MSASGVETGYLLSKGGKVMGLDISPQNAALYEETWQLPCKIASIHDTGLPDSTFDAVYICGGLHHIIPLLDETIKEISRILKPVGYFVFVEPNKDAWVNNIRNFWHKNSEQFSDEEEAISYTNDLKKYLDRGFREYFLNYGGNLAYLLIGQSMTMGVPLSQKGILARISFPIEAFLKYVPFAPKLFFIGIWQKSD